MVARLKYQGYKNKESEIPAGKPDEKKAEKPDENKP